ncbi:hypothetical protein, partial [Enterobacter mori]|uniref:hypothetical protein n=1 Tax=Enterobacter mori TaxID=539813 RepID=UPI001C9E57F6
HLIFQAGTFKTLLPHAGETATRLAYRKERFLPFRRGVGSGSMWPPVSKNQGVAAQYKDLTIPFVANRAVL